MTYKMLINGELVDGSSTLEIINPATGKVGEIAPRADAKQLNLAVAAAKAAFPAWSAKSYAERRAILERLADAMETRVDEIARLLTKEQGKPLTQASGEVAGAIGRLRAFAGMSVGSRVIRENANDRIIEKRAPLGAVGAITPWNFPISLMIMKIGPALITGNTVVLKPAPTTPLATLLVGEIAASILPPGVLNIIVDNNDLGALLTSHPDIAKVSFTGSTATGKKVMSSVSDTLKRLTLELGGNDAAIVLDDVDVKKQAPVIFATAMANTGQICLATKRVYAHSSIYDELCGEFARLAGEVVVGDGLEQGVTMGPVQNKAQYDKLKTYLDDAAADGVIIAGGKAADRDGYFIEPTVVRDITGDSRLVQEEQFGPVLPVISYDNLNDVISQVNSSDYGLGGSIWTSNVERGAEVASQIQSGTVWVNKWLDIPSDVPFRGAKQSGMGAESGQEGLEEYTQAKIINISLAQPAA